MRKLLHRLGHICGPLFVFLITVFSLTNASSTPSLSSYLKHADKMFHFGAYAILGCLLMWSIGISEASLKMKSYLPRMAIAWLIALLIGGAIEIVQPYFGRGLEVLDFICDALGAACGAAFGVISLRWADRFDQKRSRE